MRKKRQRKASRPDPTPIRKLWRETLPDVSVPDDMQLLRVPLDMIRRFPDQPRTRFDWEEVKALSRSILEVGLQIPVTLKRIKDKRFKFELVDGERRFKAHQACNKRTILAFVKEVGSKKVQFRQSVAANFGRADHTHIEIAKAVQRLDEDFSSETDDREKVIERVAAVFGHSVPWVYQYLGLLRLCPEVQELMEDEKIPFQVGVALTNLTPEKQREGARRSVAIIEKTGVKEALHYVRSLRSDPNNLTAGGRLRRPSEGYNHLERFLRRLQRESDMALDMTYKDFKGMFQNRPAKDLERAIDDVHTVCESLQQLSETLQSLKEEEVPEAQAS